jgi:uncharacterized membrane protein YkvA (DUF1232 family)
LTLRSRVKVITARYTRNYKRCPWWVKTATWILITLILLPDPFDWIPGLTFADEILYASILLHLLHKYGALPDEDKKSAKDLIKEIFVKDKEVNK